MSIATPEKMNEPITFNKKVDKKDGYGTPMLEIGEVVYSCWAMIKTSFLNEVKASIGTTLESTLTFVIYHQDVITNDLLLIFRGNKYEIVGINPDFEYKQFDTIICKMVS